MQDAANAVDFEFVLTPNPEAPEELRTVAEQYWEYEGLDPDTNEIRWAHKATRIDFKSWSGTAFHAAAAGVEASSPTFQCSICGNLLTLSSRQTLADARHGLRAECRACSGVVNERAAAVLNPANRAKRERRADDDRRAAEAQVQRNVAGERQRLQEAERDAIRRKVIEATYPAEDDDGGYSLANASLVARIGALAVIHAAGTAGGKIHPVKYDASLSATSNHARELFQAAFHAALLLIHPSSPPAAFVWQTDDPHALAGSFYGEQAIFVTVGDGPLRPRLEEFTGHLRESVQIDSLWSTDRRDLIALSQRLVVDEAIRYFQYFLTSLNLPDPAEQHLETLRSHAGRGAANFSLGQLYRMAWSSSRDAVAAYERIPGMSKTKASAHAVNKFGQWVQRALDSPEDLGEPFNEETLNLPLSAATDIVFRVVLGLTPMRASPFDVVDALAGSPDEELRRACDARIPERTELVEWLRTDQTWSGREFREALERVSGESYSLCAPGCAHQRTPIVAHQAGQMYDRLASRLDPHETAISVAEATGIGNESPYGGLAGDLALAKVLSELGRSEVETAESDEPDFVVK